MIWRFMMRVGVVFAGAVVVIACDRLVGRELFEPLVVVLVQAALVVVDEHAGRDVHGVHQHSPSRTPLSRRHSFDLGRDVDERAAAFDLEPEFFSVALHTDIFTELLLRRYVSTIGKG